jgi:hypothetical protein
MMADRDTAAAVDGRGAAAGGGGDRDFAGPDAGGRALLRLRDAAVVVAVTDDAPRRAATVDDLR